MCGIFGVIVGSGSNFTPSSFESTITKLLKLSESRGKEAAGLAAMHGETISVYKAPIPASDFIKTKEYKKVIKDTVSTGILSKREGEAIAVIGHSRLVTNGAQEIHQNNQPVITSGMVGIHNGIITNVSELWDRFTSIERQYEVDTEILLSLIRMFYKKSGSLVSSVQSAFGYIKGAASTAIMLEDSKHIVLATNNGSLYLCSNKKNVHIFASEKYILEMLTKKGFLRKALGEYSISHIDAGSCCVVNLSDLSIEKYSLDKEKGGKLSVEPSPLKKIIDIKPPGKQKSYTLKKEAPFVLPKDFVDEFPANEEKIAELKRCTKCVMPATMPFIEYDEEGVCNYCRHYKKIKLLGKDALEEIFSKCRSKSGEPDCIVGLSGGRDSSYALHYIKKNLNMNPIAYTYDWGMITDLARRNQSKMCGELGVEHVIVSADINWKRNNIRKNVEAWLKKPDMGTIPLFMAGDKQFFWYAYKLREQTGSKIVLLNENELERTDFKFGFCNIEPSLKWERRSLFPYMLPMVGRAKLAAYYGKQYIQNPAYINSSIIDTLFAYACYYIIPHAHFSIFKYVEWNEEEIDETLIKGYGWEVATDTKSTWRIGDGTAPFYNYIYYTVAGFTENDTFRSNQIREGVISRDKAMEFITADNRPRYESIKWYCDTIGIDFQETIKKINAIPKIYLT